MKLVNSAGVVLRLVMLLSNVAKTATVAVLPLLILAATSCRDSSQVSSPEPGSEAFAESSSPTVIAVNYPLSYFATRIAGDLVNVEFPAPADGDPAYWEPDREAVAAFQRADRILLNGAGYAGWVDHVTLPTSKLVDTSRDFRDRYVSLEENVTHSHGPEGAHEHGDVAFTTWLDPDLAIHQASAVAEALSVLLPDEREAFQANFEVLADELGAVGLQLEGVVSQAPDTPVIFSHPVYQYLTRRFGLNARSVHWEPDEMPSAEAWADLEQLLIQHRAGWMIWEGAPNEATVERLRTVGIESVVFDPCGNRPDEGDFMSVMQQNVENLRPVFRSDQLLP